MILLFLLPFYDRNPERRPERRPIATTAGILTIIAMGYLTYLGASAGPPDARSTSRSRTNVKLQGAKAVADVPVRPAGRRAVRLRGLPQVRRERQRRPGPGADRDRRAPAQRRRSQRTLINPPSPMPSFKGLQQSNPQQFDEMVQFLSALK